VDVSIYHYFCGNNLLNLNGPIFKLLNTKKYRETPLMEFIKALEKTNTNPLK